MSYNPDINVIVLVGQTLAKIEQPSGEMIFHTADGRSFRFYHSQDCCESVGIHDIKGDPENLIGSPILDVVETIKCGREGDNEGWPDDVDRSLGWGSWTWTLFEFITAKGNVTVRWFGLSNGYYSESVSFHEVNP